MNDKNLDSGPSDRAIAQAFRELDTCGQHSAEECAAYNRLFNRAREIEPSPGILGQGSYGGLAFPHDAIFSTTTPPAGARDAVTSHEVIAWADKYNIVGEHLVTAYTAAANRDEALTGKAASAGES